MTIIEILHIMLLFFGVISLIALTAVLYRVFKALWPVLEMIEIYNKLKWIFWMYSQIPDIIKDNVKNFLKRK
jgi:hypothetical protein